MALLPQKTNGLAPKEPTKLEEYILDRLEAAETPAQIAKRLAKGDKKKGQALRSKIWKMVRRDAEFQHHIAERARAHALVGLPAGLAGQTRRAGRGRTDATKFIAEVTGFHNPRVQHDHTGDIKITIDMPRPKFVDASVEDADVVSE